MKKVAVLGPKGTFSEVALNKYCRIFMIEPQINYYHAINKVASAYNENDLLILPIENTLDGYVQETIDALIKNNYQIICDLMIPIDFTFVANSSDIENIKSIYVQFKAKGQCLDFLEKHDFKIIQTDSNIESLELLLKSNEESGAIIPSHKASDYYFSLRIDNVKDKENNYTRFIVLSNDIKDSYLTSVIKCSLCVFALDDKPGILFNMLKEFNDLGLNLVSIMSRPNKEEMGKYNFYIECNLNINDMDNIAKLVMKIEYAKDYKVKILGIYSSII